MASVCLKKILGRSYPAVLGMIHVRALPGTPHGTLGIEKILKKAVYEADSYAQTGLDGFIIENMHDLPYKVGENIGHEITASMVAVSSLVRSKFPELAIGIQVLKAGNKQALAVAHASGCNFIRAECFAFSHVSDAGWVNASAGDLLRYRKQIDAGDVMIFSDIKKKHSSHAITSDISITEAAEAAQFFLTDGVIVTGDKTGQAASVKDLHDVLSSVDVPVLVGSGVTSDNLEEYMSANGLIIGSYFKHGGVWNNELDVSKIKAFVNKMNCLKS